MTSLLSRFPFLDGLIVGSVAEHLDQRFHDVCAQAGIAPDAPEAELIGIDLIADYASGWALLRAGAQAHIRSGP